MAKGPVCAKCGKREFELDTQKPIGSNFQFTFVQCVNCGAPAGVLENEHMPSAIDRIVLAIDGLKTEVNGLKGNVNRLEEQIIAFEKRFDE